eukprot:1634461-Pyramimonas_sp.AAC.1
MPHDAHAVEASPVTVGAPRCVRGRRLGCALQMPRDARPSPQWLNVRAIQPISDSAHRRLKVPTLSRC